MSVPLPPLLCTWAPTSLHGPTTVGAPLTDVTGDAGLYITPLPDDLHAALLKQYPHAAKAAFQFLVVLLATLMHPHIGKRDLERKEADSAAEHTGPFEMAGLNSLKAAKLNNMVKTIKHIGESSALPLTASLLLVTDVMPPMMFAAPKFAVILIKGVATLQSGPVYQHSIECIL